MNFPQETRGLFNKEITRSFPKEIVGSVSNGKFVKHYICQNGNFAFTGFPSENSRSMSVLLGLTSQKGELTK